MCGVIGGISQISLPLEDLNKGLDRLIHRGPDARGVYNNTQETVFLGHRRLSIIDLSSAANQPMTSRCGRYVLVFNGEVYNYREVAEKFNLSLVTQSDTEVILELFAKMGKACVAEFNGMFAFAIYDKEKEELFISRDRLGVKPLYLYEEGHTFYFASELKALLQIPAVKSKLTINKKAVGLFLHLGYVPQPHSIYNEIKKFPAGAHAVISKRGMTTEFYWKAEEKINPSLATSDYQEAKQTLKELLQSSIQYRMISDVPFGSFLSGGIDSSLVTALAQENSSTPVKTFSIGFKEAKFNESVHAAKVASYLKTDHEEFILSEKESMGSIEEIIDQFDEPFADSSALPTWLVSKMSSHKVKMVLTGDGGDELFMGYGAYHWAKRLSNKSFYYSRKVIQAALQLSGNSRYKRIAQLINHDANTDLRSHIFSQEQYYFSENELAEILVHPAGYLPGQWIGKTNVQRGLSAKEEQALFDLTHYLKDDLLVKVDRTSMYSSIEAREPLLDYRLIEFGLNLPESFKHKNGVDKYILKDILYDYIPKEYFDRPKWGFGIPLHNWLKGDLKFLIDNYLSEEAIARHQILDYEKVQQLVKKYISGDNYLFNRIWAMIVLQKWLSKNHGK
jgi:asparagine synthase (glutamine-hydrolysing)